MRVAIVVAVACLSAVGLCAEQDVQASMKKSTNIPAQELVPALKTLANQRGFQLVFLAKVVGVRHTQGAVGDLTTTEALTRLLEGTNLVYSYLDEKTVTIFPVNSNNKLDGQGVSGGNLHRCAGISSDKLDSVTSLNQTTSDSTAIGWNASEGASDCVENYSQENQLLASAIAGEEGAPVQNSDGDSNLEKDSTREDTIQEIVVTAQKRQERLQDVPVPVTAVSAQSLTDSNLLRLQDYQSLMPGLNVFLNDYGAPELSIRGLTTGTYANPTVGMVIDDVPFGASSAVVYGDQAPDLDVSDLMRVEELRGPQGTLYGASSLGGLIKYVTVDPSTEAWSGRVEAGLRSVYNGDQLGYQLRGSVNAPIADTFAVRGSAYTRLDPGYIDDPTLGEKGVNKGENSGGRLSALWRPSDTLYLKVSAMYQKTHIDGSSLVEPTLGSLIQRAVAGTGWFDRQMQFYSAVLQAKLGNTNLTTITGYGVNAWSDALDYTPSFGSFTQAQFGVTGTIVINDIRTNKFSQELRLEVPISDRLSWTLGSFYTNEDSTLNQNQYAAESTTGNIVGTWFISSQKFTLREYAAFTNFLVTISEKFDIQLGGRESHNEQSETGLTYTGPYNELFLGQPSPYTFPEARATGNSFTYLVTPRYRLNPNLMVYARVASGYRPGGPNLLPANSTAPGSYRPDTTRNYEVGVKADFWDRKLALDASVYYIDWKGIQLPFITPTEYYIANGSAAKSEGVEISVEARPASGLKVSTWVAWDQAVLTEDLPVDVAPASAGARLPATPRFSGNLSIEQEFRMSSEWMGVGAVSVSYVGQREGGFVYGSPERQNYSGFTQLNLRVGARCDTWEGDLFVNNLTNKQGVLDGGFGALNPDAFHLIQPRTIGLSAIRKF